MKGNFRSLNEIITFRGGGTPRKDVPAYWSDEIPWASVKDFKSLDLSRTQDSISQKGLEASASNLIPAGHVIIPTRMALGKAAINSIDMAINQDLRALIPKVPLDSRYLLHSMIGLADEIVRYGSGATVKGITQENLGKLQIPLPPLAEQKRIAAILDAADALRAKRRQSIAQLDALIQSTFLDLVDHSSASLSSALLSDICQPDAPITYGILQPGPHIEGGIPYVLPSEIKYGQENLNAIRRTTQKIASKYIKSDLQAGDILITIVGTIGSIAVIPKELEGGNITQSSARVRINRTKAEPLFVEHFLRSKLAKRQYDEKRLGVAVERLNLHHVRDLEVPIPPLSLQQKFAAIVESIERQKTTQRTHLAELDALFASLQHRAFRGEL
jgi:type I restriction enzyme S subunit